MYDYSADITDCHDGDTCTMDTIVQIAATLVIHAQDIGFHFKVKEQTIPIVIEGEFSDMKLRLAGINADELITATGKLAQQHLAAMILDKTLEMKTTKMSSNNFWDAQEKYGRYLATIFLPDGTSANQKMVDDGFAVSKKYTLDGPYMAGR